MVRIRVIFIAVCIVLIAAAFGAVLYLRLGFSVADAILVALFAAVRAAIEGGRIDLHLQPIVTLPQRKVRYYEALSRLNAENGVGLFCNLSAATLTDAGLPQLLELIDANRAIAPSLIFEFTQDAVRAMGLTEHAGLAALAGRGFHFSMDNLSDLRIESRELTEAAFVSSRCRRRCCSADPAPLRPPSGRPNCPTGSAASASISSPTGSRANRSWSIFWITMSASARGFCSRRRARCVRMRCKAWPAPPLPPRRVAGPRNSFTPAAEATDPRISSPAHSTR